MPFIIHKIQMAAKRADNTNQTIQKGIEKVKQINQTKTLPDCYIADATSVSLQLQYQPFADG